jgi:hypothetical protein
LGRTVLVQRLAEGRNSLTLNLNEGLFKNGIYMVSAVTDGQRLTKRNMAEWLEGHSAIAVPVRESPYKPAI